MVPAPSFSSPASELLLCPFQALTPKLGLGFTPQASLLGPICCHFCHRSEGKHLPFPSLFPFPNETSSFQTWPRTSPGIKPTVCARNLPAPPPTEPVSPPEDSGLATCDTDRNSDSVPPVAVRGVWVLQFLCRKWTCELQRGVGMTGTKPKQRVPTLSQLRRGHRTACLVIILATARKCTRGLQLLATLSASPFS